MLLLTPESARWRWITLLLGAVMVAAYWWASRDGFAHGGSTTGLAFGVLAAVLLAFLLFYWVRKRFQRGAPGRLESWCQAHVYLGLLVVVAVVLHSGFRFHDRVAVAALAVMGAVVASGLLGAVLYTVVPFLLTGAESNVSPQELSAQLHQKAQLMTRLVAGRSAALQEICRLVQADAEPAALGGWRLLFFPPRSAAQAAPAPWSRLLAEVPPAEAEQLESLVVQVRQFQELHRSLLHYQRYRNLLVAWLWLHVPLSAALVALVIAHVVAVFYYRSF
jgi:hypothetical protein